MAKSCVRYRRKAVQNEGYDLNVCEKLKVCRTDQAGLTIYLFEGNRKRGTVHCGNILSDVSDHLPNYLMLVIVVSRNGLGPWQDYLQIKQICRSETNY
jgi:hypothetical protein